MAEYRSYTHVLRYDKPEVQGILNGTVEIFSKVDGTNASIFSDGLTVRYGSRKREITPEDDNAGFASYASKSEDMAGLRQLVLDNPNLIIYGEWLSGLDGSKMCGSLKKYLRGGFHVFDVFDIERGDYMSYDEYSTLLDGVYDYVIPPLAILDHPTENEVLAYTEQAHYDLPDGIEGEGITIKQRGFRDSWGNIQIAKVVRAEFREDKGKKKQQFNPEDVEFAIANDFVTNADCEKCKQKIETKFGGDFDTSDKKYIGAFLQMLYQDCIEEELWSIIKKYGKYPITFSKLDRVIKAKGREFLGL